MTEAVKSFSSFAGGIRNKRANPLDFPENALWAGENVCLDDGALRTRPGVSVTSSDSLPASEVMALSQVRFPSNEVSYLVAQCRDAGIPFSSPDQDDSPPARTNHYACYDSFRGRIWVFGGESLETGNAELNDLWYYDCTEGTWTEITDATGAPTWTASRNDMVYDPVEDRLIVFVGWGHTSGGLVIGNNGWMEYDIEGNTWAELKAEEDPSFVTLTGSYDRKHGRMILRDRTAVLYGGWDGEQPLEFATFDVDTYAINYDPYVWTVEGGGDGVGRGENAGMAYDSVNDILMIAGGSERADAWLLDFDTMVQTQIDDVPVEEGAYFQGGTVCYCSDKWYALGSDSYLESTLLSEVSWVYSDGAWTQCAFIPDPDIRFGGKAFVVGADIVMCLGQHGDNDPETGEPIPVNGAEILSGICTWDPSATTTNRLYASNDQLPTTSGTFTQIYNLGEADRVSFGVLNDRVVITEGKAQPPLVWGGCRAADASDWMYPKAVLVSQDGENFYDVSAQVLDKDVDNAAGIGLIRASGYLAICTDMPLVEGFYFEMETPNGVSTEDPGNQQTATVELTSSDNVAYQDLKGIIVNWVQDSGATGHFTDSGNNPVTLGAGNQAPDVETGLRVVFAATDSNIVSITDDGEGSGEVTLSDAITTQTVTEIVGFKVDATGLVVNEDFSSVLTTWSKSPGADSMRCSGYSIRQVIPGSEIAYDGDTFTLTIRSGPYSYGGVSNLRGDHHWKAYQYTQPVLLSRISIVERDGETANGATEPTPITFPIRPFTRVDLENGQYNDTTHPSFVFTDYSGTFYATISSRENSTNFSSDQIEFAIDQTKDYLLIMDVMDVWAATRLNDLHRTNGGGYYLVTDPVNAPETWNVADVSEYDVTFQAGYAIGAVEIQTQDRYPLPTQLLVAHTTDEVHFDMSVIEDFQGVAVNQTALGSTHVYHAVSLDDRATFQVFLNDAWRTIVKEDGVWQYLDGSDVWQNASADTLLQALREAFAITENQMNATELAEITRAQWTGTGGIVVHITPHMDFAVGMLADATHVPLVTSYTLTYNDTGATTIQGWRGDRWTAGSGFTDNTRLNDIPWGQSGTVIYNGASPFEAQYHVLDEVPGYWFRFMSNGTSSGTSITRVLYKAPCQPLANIGDGQPDTPLAFIFHDVSKDSKKDLTLEVSGARGSFTTDSEGKVIYSATDALIPMGTDDYLYVGYILQFDQIEVTPYDNANAVVSTLSAEYWNGEDWAELEITDGTVDTATSTKTLFTKGKISWLLPDDWKMHIPLDADFKRGYYVRFKVSVALTSSTSIDEVRVYAIPNELAKHRFAVSFRDRIALVSRPDAPDQVDISRALGEYGFIGSDSGSYRVGGMDSIQCAVSAWNGLFLGKTESWHQLLGQTPADFAWQGVEAARSVPINTRVCVKAPAGGFGGDGDRYGLFFINRFGAFVASGLHVDASWNSTRSQVLSELTNWWTADALPRLDLNNLHIACGEYWPVKNWLVWSVPMITEVEQTEQTTNNRLIVYDLSLQAWLPPFTISVASLCQGYAYCEGAAGHIGPVSLYGGDYEGRILRLFESTDDVGEDIDCYAETGWLAFGQPATEKILRYVWIFGHAEEDITLEVFVDGGATAYSTTTLSGMTDISGMFTANFANQNVKGRFIKFRLSWTGAAQIYGFEVGLTGMRDVPGGA